MFSLNSDDPKSTQESSKRTMKIPVLREPKKNLEKKQKQKIKKVKKIINTKSWKFEYRDALNENLAPDTWLSTRGSETPTFSGLSDFSHENWANEGEFS